ncbi:MAG: cell wall-binding repeat-containing protein [Tissierellia bacterium]|nr:cell wall-binding repeat-containing protein [Tissierellia bacterium]
MLSRKRFVSIILAILIVFSTLSPLIVLADQGKEVNIIRISGQNRYHTSVNSSRTIFKQAIFAVVASGDSFPDALVGGVLASHLKAPLFIIPKEGMTSDVMLELIRLGVVKVYILGGYNTLSEYVEMQLSDFYFERLYGANRYETAKKVDEKIRSLRHNIKHRYYADGRNFPDALTAAPFVVRNNSTMLLSDGSPILDGIAIGGQSSVPGNIPRISGNTRYETAVEIAKNSGDIDGVIIVDGTNYPDALSASSVSFLSNMPILLTHPNGLSETSKEFIKDNDLETILIFGGENSVSNKVYTEIKELTENNNYKPEDPIITNDAIKPVLGLKKDLAKEMLNMVNAAREDKGIYPLKWDDNLANAAEIRSKELVKSFSHTRPDGSSFSTVSPFAKAENIAYLYDPSSRSAFDLWMNSQGHKDNILRERDDIDAIGIACNVDDTGKYNWVQIFGTNSNSNQPVLTDKPSTNAYNEEYEKEMARLVNEIRSQHGKYTLTWDENLTAAARIRAKEIVDKFSHNRPDGSNWDTISSNAWAKNIAWHPNGTPENVTQMFMNSKGHRKNILDERSLIKSVGIGCWIDSDGYMYSVQLFGTPEN